MYFEAGAEIFPAHRHTARRPVSRYLCWFKVPRILRFRLQTRTSIKGIQYFLDSRQNIAGMTRCVGIDAGAGIFPAPKRFGSGCKPEPAKFCFDQNL
jgi:hypothetical protein